jgi:hypothetical protein
MVFTEYQETEIFEPKYIATRRLLNLMTATRLYLDSLPHHANEVLVNDPTTLASVKQAPSVAYDSALGYRVMEALRNVSQHRMLPIQNWTTHMPGSRSTAAAAVLKLRDCNRLSAVVCDETESLKRHS